MGHLGTILAPSWARLGSSWGGLGQFWPTMGPSWDYFGASWTILGSSWEFLGTSWPLGRPKGRPRKPQDDTGGSQDDTGGSQDVSRRLPGCHHGSTLAHLIPSWRPLHLGSIWAGSQCHVGPSWANLGKLGLKTLPKGSPGSRVLPTFTVGLFHKEQQ